MLYISPLRYPGGKGKLGPYFARLLADQTFSIQTYAEPYAGGSGAGLFLLSEGYIEKLLINDLNPGIAAFWTSVLTEPEMFIDRIYSVAVDLDSWHRYREVYSSPDKYNDLELGFATFFLNRCNRSGIITARPIGGLEQTGRWKIDARFNRDDLAERVRYIASMGSRISVTQKPALRFLASLARRKNPVLLYVDPPYIGQGDDLYMSSHSWPEHEQLAHQLNNLRHPWILTYNTDFRIRGLYQQSKCLEYNISHTAQAQRVGREFMIFSPDLRVNDITVVAKRKGRWVGG